MWLLPEWSTVTIPVIGMLHAPPLPGSAGFHGDFESVLRFVLKDAEALRDGGVDGLMLENFGDAPFYPQRVPRITVAAMTALAVAIRQRIHLPLGINVLRNDGHSALAIAAVCGAAFIRVNVLCGARVTDQGLIQGTAHELVRERAAMGRVDIGIIADVDVKHSAPLAARPIDVETRELVERGHADAVIVSGTSTGQPTDAASVAAVRQAANPVPVFVGSGVSSDNLAELIRSGAGGLIVGSSIKHDGNLAAPVDPQRVRRLMDAVRMAAVGL